MAGLVGNAAWIAAGKQTAKGTPAATMKHTWGLAGGGVEPVRETEQLQETDADRDPGVSYVSRSGVEGNVELYARDNSVDFWLAAALGAVADSGTTNFIHDVTPADQIPYLTVQRMLGNTLWEEFTDVQVSEITLRAEAGGPLMVSVGLMGLAPERLTSDPTPPALESGTVYTYNDATVTLGAAGTQLISSFELSLTNNMGFQQTNAITPFDMSVGFRDVQLSFDMIVTNLDEYNKFHYGGASGTAVSPNLYITDILFAFAKGANNGITLDLNSVAWEEFPLEAQPDGSPVVVSVRGRGQRTAGDMLTAQVKNQKSTTF